MPVSMPWVFSPSLPRMLDCPKSWQPWYATSPFSEKQKSYLGNSGNLIILRKTLLRDRFLSLHLFKNLDSVWSTNQTHSHSGYHLVQIHLVLQVLYYNMYFKLLSWQAEGGCKKPFFEILFLLHSVTRFWHHPLQEWYIFFKKPQYLNLFLHETSHFCCYLLPGQEDKNPY